MNGSRIMEKGKLALGGISVPGVIVSEPVAAVATSSTGRNIPTYRADVITLRETNPANGPVRTYPRKTNEDLGFWFPRSRHIVGLDVSADGTLIDLDELSDLTMEATLAFQAQRLAAQAEPEVALD